ncbi:MAG: cysteine desulfurase family protein [Cyanobacteria bacterium J06642_2]
MMKWLFLHPTMLTDFDPALYFDCSATTPPRPEAMAAVVNAMQSQWGNPSSLHLWGQRAATVLEIARQQVASAIGTQSDRIVFTSGGTEADNLAVMGIARRYATPQHLIISSVEHSAIDNAARRLEGEGWQVARLPVSADGVIAPDTLSRALQNNTALVSVIHGQSEVGTLQPIAALGAVCRAAEVPFHTDAVQTMGRLEIDVESLPVDLLSLSSHKIYGPQGAGALYIRSGLDLAPLSLGGKQENQMRAGTQAVPAIAGFGMAAQLICQDIQVETARLRSLQRRLASALADIPALTLTGPSNLDARLPHHLSYVVRDRTGEWLVVQLSRQGMAISSGSACNSGQLSPSRVLLAMGYSSEGALGAIRLTLGHHSTEAGVDRLANTLRTLLSRDPLSAISA